MEKKEKNEVGTEGKKKPGACYPFIPVIKLGIRHPRKKE